MDCMCTLRDSTNDNGRVHSQHKNSQKLGFLGFALAKGLIRRLINRYPDPPQATEIN